MRAVWLIKITVSCRNLEKSLAAFGIDKVQHQTMSEQAYLRELLERNIDVTLFLGERKAFRGSASTLGEKIMVIFWD